MTRDTATTWRDKKARQLVEALLSISDESTMQNFLRDVMTEREIVEISARLEAAKMLTEGKKYNEIIAETKLSSRTVARISEWLKDGTGGYRAALAQTHHDHLPPARAE